MTLADVLASVDRNSRDALIEDVENALIGHTAAEVFLATTYFLALAINLLPCEQDPIINDMPQILRSIIRNELDTVTRQ